MYYHSNCIRNYLYNKPDYSNECIICNKASSLPLVVLCEENFHELKNISSPRQDYLSEVLEEYSYHSLLDIL